MAFKPSKRKSKGQEDAEADMLPIMGLMCILIPLLLSSSQTIKLGMIELNLPKASGGGGGGSSQNNEPKEKKRKLSLNLTLTEKGYFVGSALGIATMEGEPTIAKKGTEYDYNALSKYLYDIKVKAEGVFVDANSITIVAEKDIEYKFLIHSMDAARIYKDDTGKRHLLFPSVSIAAGIM